MTGNVRNVKVQLWNKPALLSSEGEQLVKFEFQNCDSLEMLGPLFVARQQSSVIMLPRLSSPQTRTVAFEVLSADTNMFTEIPCCYVSSKCHIWWQSKFSMKLIRGWQDLSAGICDCCCKFTADFNSSHAFHLRVTQFSEAVTIHLGTGDGGQERVGLWRPIAMEATTSGFDMILSRSYIC